MQQPPSPHIYNIQVNGVLHIGAHVCEEAPLYKSWSVPDQNIVWVDAIPRVDGVYAALISDTDGEQVTFRITNNHQSSSMLELGTHLSQHPDVYEIGQQIMTTTTVNTFLKRLPPDVQKSINYLHLDIQGAELKALKGASALLQQLDVIVTEVNMEHLYKDCALLPDIDSFLLDYGFKRVGLSLTKHQWGDAMYIKKHGTGHVYIFAVSILVITGLLIVCAVFLMLQNYLLS